MVKLFTRFLATLVFQELIFLKYCIFSFLVDLFPGEYYKLNGLLIVLLKKFFNWYGKVRFSKKIYLKNFGE